MGSDVYDIAIIGGGINGCAIARDAAGRGLKVFLCDKGDLGGATSSASTKLLHGGLRYLETHEFGMVHKSLRERNTALAMCPHIGRELGFVIPQLPHNKRPLWLVRLGLYVYDALAFPSKLKMSRLVNLRTSIYGAPLQEGLTYGFTYSDGWVDDNRLVILNALEAKQRGAAIMPHTPCTRAEPRAGAWRLTVGGKQVHARLLVNATGPWAAGFLKEAVPMAPRKNLRLVKGSHIVVKKQFAHDHAYLFQHDDGRIIFAIPYEGEFTLIGTTDVPVKGPADAHCSAEEVEYLCRAASTYFANPINPGDVVWHYAGIRPLVDDHHASASKISRDYKIELDESCGAPLLNIWGGKLTTFRRLAEEALETLSPHLAPAQRKGWTGRKTPLPGGDLPPGGTFAYSGVLSRRYPWLTAAMATRYARTYGTLAEQFLAGKTRHDHLGRPFGGTLYQAEVDYLIDHEWATDAHTVLWHRTKLGLWLSDRQKRDLETYITRKIAHT